MTERTLPAAWYTDPEVLRRERQAIFGREWQPVGASSLVARPGSYLSGDVAGAAVVVVRDERGRLRAFHNVCRHRAGPLVTDRSGTCRGGLVCRYHGWTYTLAGELRSARDFGGDVAGDLSLHGIAVEEWRGIVFVNINATAGRLADWLGDFATEASAFDMEDFVLTHESSHVVHCNWKAYADNYGEGYHIPFVHPELNRQIDARRYEVEVRGRWCLHRAPAGDGSLTTGRWLWRYPNLALNLYPDGMNVERYTPVDVATTRVDYSFFFRAGRHDDETVKLSESVLAEDAAICEAVQRNLANGFYRDGVLSPRHESGLALFHRLVREALE